MDDWRDEAACSSDRNDPDLWFSEDPNERRVAQQICAECPVLDLCREWAIEEWPDTPDEWVVGGMTKRQLKKVRAEKGVRTPPALGFPRPEAKPKVKKDNAYVTCKQSHCQRRPMTQNGFDYCRTHYDMGFGRKKSAPAEKTYSKSMQDA